MLMIQQQKPIFDCSVIKTRLYSYTIKFEKHFLCFIIVRQFDLNVSL